MYAKKLQKGDEIRVIAPSESLSSVEGSVIDKAVGYLQSKGYRITFSNNSRAMGYDNTAAIQSRVDDLHHAFSDKNVKAVLASAGGFHVNQILEYIDYSVLKNNPKIICGYSDITALLTAIYTKTGLITYHGPNFSSFGFDENREYTFDYFEKCVGREDEYSLTPSSEAGQYKVIREGSCEGVIIGGNLCTLNLLQGTEFMPKLHEVILFLEDDNIMGDYFKREFERNLQSLLQVRGCQIRGIVFGRFTDDCGMATEVIRQIVKNKKQLKDVPVIFNVDFGHVFPLLTIPIGGWVKIAAKGDQAAVVFSRHEGQ